jgi:hypothetical protein
MLSLLFIACSKKEGKMPSYSQKDLEKFSLQFAEHMSNRKYAEAYEMTSSEYQTLIDLNQFKTDFEKMIPLDWGKIAPIEIGDTLKNWPEKQSSDLIWIYISLGGDVYSEAVTIVISTENENLRISELKFGRP